MATQYAVFVGGYAVATAENVEALAEEYQAVYAEWKAVDTDTKCPVIRRVTDNDRNAVTRVLVSGSLEEQVAVVVRTLQATLLGTVVIDCTSQHIRNWFTGAWKAKSAVAQQLLTACENARWRGVAVEMR